MRRFGVAVEDVEGERVTFAADESCHLARVLRLRAGDTVIACDGTGRELTVRLETVGERCTGTVIAVARGSAESPLAITLLQGVPKGDKMEGIVRAVTELGVARVWPVVAERTIVRLDAGRWKERARRWQRVAREATKQSRRAVVPVVEPPRPLSEWLDALGPDQPSALRICLWEGDAPVLASVLEPGGTPAEVYVLVGPEGGLAREEVDTARSHGFRVASLGGRVLRTETAGPAAISILQWELGDLGS
ncbi:MAG: 16S rRNA (uracil(1498)-N(3))-methyltransferase [Candidatus Rokubacteria bacterium]|nr:16S rRNA (uracil(1498)-N(3))-methyltransferase [Candidatus Rokubacteria bacterium]